MDRPSPLANPRGFLSLAQAFTIQGVLDEVLEERVRQVVKFGEQNHDDPKWLVIAAEEFGEVGRAILEEGPERVREELVQLAAVCGAWVEAIDRRQGE